jgi:hypothetical protein
MTQDCAKRTVASMRSKLHSDVAGAVRDWSDGAAVASLTSDPHAEPASEVEAADDRA